MASTRIPSPFYVCVRPIKPDHINKNKQFLQTKWGKQKKELTKFEHKMSNFHEIVKKNVANIYCWRKRGECREHMEHNLEAENKERDII